MGNYVCPDFNELCVELGVQCCMTMNPKTYQIDFLLQNLGNKKVAVFTDDWFREIAPGQETLFSMPNTDTPWMTVWNE
jgi:hypothetical protein